MWCPEPPFRVSETLRHTSELTPLAHASVSAIDKDALLLLPARQLGPRLRAICGFLRNNLARSFEGSRFQGGRGLRKFGCRTCEGRTAPLGLGQKMLRMKDDARAKAAYGQGVGFGRSQRIGRDPTANSRRLCRIALALGCVPALQRSSSAFP